jgi:hypothetical protein
LLCYQLLLRSNIVQPIIKPGDYLTYLSCNVWFPVSFNKAHFPVGILTPNFDRCYKSSDAYLHCLSSSTIYPLVLWIYVHTHTHTHTSPQSILLWLFYTRDLENYLPWLAPAAILPISASQVVRIIGVSHWHLAIYIIERIYVVILVTQELDIAGL